MRDDACSGSLGWWSRWSPGPWAALVWLPLMLAEPVVQLVDHPSATFAVGLLAVAFVAAVVSAHGLGGRVAKPRRRRPSTAVALLAQTAATVWVSTLLPTSSALWAWVLLGLAFGAAAHPRWALWATGLAAMGAAVSVGRGDGWGGAVGGCLTVLAAGVGTYSFYRLFDTVAELRRTRAELADLAVQEERDRFSRDLHDLLGHSLSLVVVKAEAVRRLAPTDLEAAVGHAADIEDIGRRALLEVRQAVAGYRGDGLETELLRAASSLRAAGVAVEVRADRPLPHEVAADAVLGWAVREAATNVARHANASGCVITVHSSAAETALSVEDDGRWSAGLSMRAGVEGSDGAAGVGHGLAGVRERVFAVGGRVEVGPTATGFRVHVVVPVTSAAPVTSR